MIRVKICGIRNVEEASMAVHAGADAIGLIVGALYKTEDELNIPAALGILKAVPPYITTVLVTHLTSANDILGIYHKVPTSAIQLQNNVTLHDIAIIRKNLPYTKLIKSVHVEDMSAIETAQSLAPYVDALLVDSRTKDRIGGTGIVHDWNISCRIVPSVNKPVVLAGGLNPGNVLEAINRVKPFGVDVNSGVELPDGRKDPEKIESFIRLSKNICN
jgi:phosphoribosylanthranilate isomerase